jgi:hypothetical protein
LGFDPKMQAREVLNNPEASLADKSKAYETIYGRKYGS